MFPQDSTHPGEPLAPAAKAVLELFIQLPQELQLMVLESDISACYLLVTTSKKYEQLYIQYRNTIIRSILLGYPFEVRKLILANYAIRCGEDPLHNLLQVPNSPTCRRVEFRERNARGVLFYLYYLIAENSQLTAKFAHDKLRNLSHLSTIEHPEAALFPLTLKETHRLSRSMFRFQLLTAAFYYIDSDHDFPRENLSLVR
ncbi:MAG: hypothetical protein Q9165_005491 [Trypethelium subeluteriae]